jgi:beta-lactamase class A
MLSAVIRVALLAAALALAAPAAAGELESPRGWEAFYGGVTARAPAGATTAELLSGRHHLVTGLIAHGVARFRPRLKPGRYDLRIRFRGAHGRILGRAESKRVWLLAASARQTRRERTRDPHLSAALGRLGRAFPSYAGFWVHDLSTGRTAGWNADASFPAASTVKLGVLVAALDRFGAGPHSEAWNEIRDVATWSSNLASNRLLVMLGGSEYAGARIVQDTLHRMGATSSTFTGNYELDTVRTGGAPRPLPLITYRRTTAHDLGRILVELHAAALGNRLSLRRTHLTRHEARVALGLLLSSDPRGDNLGLLRPAVAPSLPLAQKNGWTTTIRHTAAILYLPRGPLVVVVLTYGPSLRPESSRVLGGQVLRTILHDSSFWG